MQINDRVMSESEWLGLRVELAKVPEEEFTKGGFIRVSNGFLMCGFSFNVEGDIHPYIRYKDSDMRQFDREVWEALEEERVNPPQPPPQLELEFV